jgi:dephospho-CoA kinase
LNSQASDTERLAIAGLVIENNGTIEETMRQVDALWWSALSKRASG